MVQQPVDETLPLFRNCWLSFQCFTHSSFWGNISLNGLWPNSMPMIAQEFSRFIFPTVANFFNILKEVINMNYLSSLLFLITWRTPRFRRFNLVLWTLIYFFDLLQTFLRYFFNLIFICSQGFLWSNEIHYDSKKTYTFLGKLTMNYAIITLFSLMVSLVWILDLCLTKESEPSFFLFLIYSFNSSTGLHSTGIRMSTIPSSIM